MLKEREIFGGRVLIYLYLLMTFKELALDLMHQGWRCYYIEDVPTLTRGNTLQALAIRSLIQVVTYDGKKLVFVKTVQPKNEKKEEKNVH